MNFPSKSLKPSKIIKNINDIVINEKEQAEFKSTIRVLCNSKQAGSY